MRHAVIMAGGAGTRLWPLSRRMRPKQLLRLFDGQSLLQIARERLRGVFEPENIWVITSAHYLDQVAAELPDIPRANLIGEPMGRDTSNAIGLAANLLARRDPDATMAVFTADHIIEPQERFAAAIECGLQTAEQVADSLVTFGITPRGPHTGYGYLHRGTAVSSGVFEVAEFKEKPDLETAERYVASGAYYWNSGMFAWRVPAILAELERCLPENAAGLKRLAAEWDALQTVAARGKLFGQLEKISIDFGVMEQARRVLLVEMDCDWKDLGSWISIAETRTPDEQDNVIIAENAILADTERSIVVTETDHLITLLGVEDLVIVQSADATLICRRDAVEGIKGLAELRREVFGEQYE